MNHKIDRTTNLTFYERIENFYIKACESIKKKNKHIFVKPDWKVKYAVPVDNKQSKDISENTKIVLYSNGVKHILEKNEKCTVSLQCIFSFKYDDENEKFDGLVFIDYRRKWTCTTNELDGKKISMNWSQDIPMSFVHSKKYLKHIECVENILENIVRDYIRFQIIPNSDFNEINQFEKVETEIEEETKEPELVELNLPPVNTSPVLKPINSPKKVSCFLDEPSLTPISIQGSPIHFFTERPFSFTPVQSSAILVRANSFEIVKDNTSSKIINRGESKTNLEAYNMNNDMVTIPRELYNLLVKLSNETLQKIDSFISDHNTQKIK